MAMRGREGEEGRKERTVPFLSFIAFFILLSRTFFASCYFTDWQSIIFFLCLEYNMLYSRKGLLFTIQVLFPFDFLLLLQFLSIIIHEIPFRSLFSLNIPLCKSVWKTWFKPTSLKKEPENSVAKIFYSWISCSRHSSVPKMFCR